MVWIASCISATIRDEQRKKDKELSEELGPDEKAELVEHHQLFLLVLLRSASRMSRIAHPASALQRQTNRRRASAIQHTHGTLGTTPNHIMHTDSELGRCRESARSTRDTGATGSCTQTCTFLGKMLVRMPRPADNAGFAPCYGNQVPCPLW